MLPLPIQLLEYQTDMRRCRFDTLGKSPPAPRAGAPTARGWWVSPRPVGESDILIATGGGPPTGRGTWYCPRPVGGCQAVPTDKYSPLVLLLHVGGPPPVAIGMSDSPTGRGLTHRPRAVGAPARGAGGDFPTGINLAHCSART